MPKGPAWRPAARRRDYEHRRDWHLFLVKQWQRSYFEYHGHPYRAPNRKATCARYEDRRRKSRARKRHMAKVLRPVSVMDDILAAERRAKDQATYDAEHVAELAVYRRRAEREDKWRQEHGLNSLPEPARRDAGAEPGAVGRVRDGGWL